MNDLLAMGLMFAPTFIGVWAVFGVRHYLIDRREWDRAWGRR